LMRWPQMNTDESLAGTIASKISHFSDGDLAGRGLMVAAGLIPRCWWSRRLRRVATLELTASIQPSLRDGASP